MNSSCKDFRVLDSVMANSLAFEIENNTCNTATTIVWVKLPVAKAGLNNVVYAFYGNNTASDGQNKAGVWSNGFSLVYHLSDLSDSTGTKNLDNYGGVTDTGVRGIATTAYYYGGVANYSSANVNIGLQTIHGPSAVSLWAKPASTSGTKYLFTDWCSEWGLYHSGANSYARAYSTTGVDSFVSGTWYHIAVSHAHPNPGYVNTTIRTFANGAFKYQANWTFTTQNGYTDSQYSIGGDGCYAGTFFNGTIDEVRVSKVARSDDWLIAEYAQTYSVGSEQVN
ncbi:Concanavalin A-like lectin/glucanases superfamily protein [uncultured archaeon]|nr:Concanavalin A-like lectin/glucanases superfamily protein [uncultured archaeon]